VWVLQSAPKLPKRQYLTDNFMDPARFSRLVLAHIFFMLPLIFAGPQLFRDMKVERWEPAIGLKVDAASCHSFNSAISYCFIDYSDLKGRHNLQHFVYGRYGKEEFQLVRSVENPDHISSSTAVRDIDARKGTMAFWILLILAMIVRGVFMFLPPRERPVRERKMSAEEIRSAKIDAVIAERARNLANPQPASVGPAVRTFGKR
jgi:hypothetical protein